MENSMDKSLSELKRNIRIRTQQGEVEVNGARHNRPGMCPHCYKEIPLSSVIFKKIDVNNDVVAFTGRELAAEYGVLISQQDESFSHTPESKPGECPYCHEQIPINELIFRDRRG
ncbi:hypothetical protein BXY41_109201 [Lacrimispora xylanisolvens]|uniref:Uncharacterized protein n=1 Tax=Lacrimispora xylanisolvens TaxID=384636 RepID=A0A2S6HQ81_9FIRM|nr:hypothetical protein [Hungatella xylanolytica]PPK79722.1 hypothetical protein BXY41_109201 [Hungatella xylanolytica]